MILLPPLLFITLLTVGFIWRRRVARGQKQARIRQLLTWSTQTQALDPVQQQWTQSLSPAEAAVLLDLLEGYCTSLNWELGWLFTPQIEKAPTLKAAVEDSVGAYVRAILLSLQLEEDVRAYHVYLNFEKKPYGRKQRALIEQLYLKINKGNLTPPARRFFRRLVRSNVTHKEKVAAIRQAFARDPEQTMAALKEVLSLSSPAIDAEMSLEPSSMSQSSLRMTPTRMAM